MEAILLRSICANSLQPNSVNTLGVLLRAGKGAWKKGASKRYTGETPPKTDPSLLRTSKIGSLDSVLLWNIDGCMCISTRNEVQRVSTSGELRCHRSSDEVNVW